MSSQSLPNIVYIHAHDAGRFIAPYGFPVETPSLSAFAREGVLFRKAFATSPTCTPSRVGMLTGQPPHESGVFGLTNQGWLIDDYDKHLVHVLNEIGYETALAGCQHEAARPHLEPLEYARLLDEEETGEFYPPSVVHAEEYIAEKAGEQRGGSSPGGAARPFFLSFGTDEPHRNNKAREDLGIGDESARFSKTRYYDPEKLDWRYTAPLPFLPDLPKIRKDVESLARGAQIMDEYMGRVIGAIDQHGLSENTLVIVTTDHGIEFPGGKKTLTEWGTGVMLMMRFPGRIPPGKVVEPIVSHLDVVPTILELIGDSPREWHRGRSLLELVNGDADAVHDAIFTEQTYHGRLEPLRCVRTERYKLIRRHFPDGPRMRQDGPSTDVVEPFGWYDQERGREELYDLYLDPMEACNRVSDSHYSDVAEELRGRLEDWMRETGDCFPSGEFPPPPREG
jgi:arylsulfatase A-like enzyme